MTRLATISPELAKRLKAIAENLNLAKSNKVDATAWFLGPRAENAEALLKFVQLAAQSHIDARLEYMPSDPAIFSGDDAGHQQSIAIIQVELDKLLCELKSSIPLSSYRNQSHMYWDITLPGVVGYFAAMLYNQNNVATEASPVTTVLEIEVGKDLCNMLGFKVSRPDQQDEQDTRPEAWGHITCDGSIANGESMWAARNLKYLPVALAAAIATESDLERARVVTVETCQGGRGRLIDLDLWTLLNLPIDTVIGLVADIVDNYDIKPSIIHHAVDQFSVQNLGMVRFQQRFLDTYDQARPVVLVPATAHYSWPKSAALLGLGTDAVQTVAVDLNGRMCINALRRALDKCLRERRPVLQVVAVLGSTEEGAIDPLADIVELRREFQQMGLNFVLHADAAWGGYFTAMLREPKPDVWGEDPARVIDDFPELYLSSHFKRHYAAMPEVDSVTLDPHKSGFIPYPAGSLCYRHGAMRDLIAFTSPVVFHGGVDATVGPYGIEGSKPGAAAASVYLSHKVIPLNSDGYGRLLGRCLFNSKRFYAALITLDLVHQQRLCSDSLSVQLTSFQRLPTEQQGASEKEIRAQKQYIADNFIDCSTPDLIHKVMGLGESKRSEAQKAAEALFREIGSDLSIVVYAFNFTSAAGQNQDPHLMNQLNDKIYRALSLPQEGQQHKGCPVPTLEMFVTASEFEPAKYGPELVDNFAERAGVTPVPGQAIKFLISTTQNPWLSSTTEHNVMIGRLMEVLSNTALQAAREIVEQQGLD